MSGPWRRLAGNLAQLDLRRRSDYGHDDVGGTASSTGTRRQVLGDNLLDDSLLDDIVRFARTTRLVAQARGGDSMKEYPLRPYTEYLPEQQYLTGRMNEVEKGMGKIAARLGEPTPITESLDVLDRARELVADLYKQVTVRPLVEAVETQLRWLDRAEARLGQADGEPKNDLTRIPIDRVLLETIRQGWRTTR